MSDNFPELDEAQSALEELERAKALFDDKVAALAEAIGCSKTASKALIKAKVAIKQQDTRLQLSLDFSPVVALPEEAAA